MVSSVRPFSIRTGPQKDFDKYFVPKSLQAFFQLLDISDTVANLTQTTLTDNDITKGTFKSLQWAILQIEKIFKVWLANGIGGVTVDANTYSLFYYYKLYFTYGLNDLLSGQAYTDIQIDVNAVPTPDEPHIEEWFQRLGAAGGLLHRKIGVPGVNRLWDSNGDTYQITVMAAISMLEMLGAYIGALANTVVFSIQYAKQFNHRLSDISIGKDSPLPDLLQYLDDPSGITPGGAYADHVAVFDVSGLPNSTEQIKSMLTQAFKLSNFGMNYGRKFYGYGKRVDNDVERHFVHLFGVGSDSLASDVFIAAPGVAALIHLWSLYTDAVNAMNSFLNHPHNSWANLKSYADSAFSDSGFSKFGGYCEDVFWTCKNFYLLVDTTVSNGLFTNLARMDEAADTASDVLELLITADDGRSLFVDMMTYENVKDLFLFYLFNSMELNDLTMRLRFATGMLIVNNAGQTISWIWDNDATNHFDAHLTQFNLTQATIEGIFDVKHTTKPLTLSSSLNYYALYLAMPTETTELEYAAHHSILGQLILECIHNAKSSDKGKSEVVKEKEE